MPAARGVGQMIREIYREYHLPMPPYGMSIEEIKFWYEPLVPALIEMQITAEKIKREKNGRGA